MANIKQIEGKNGVSFKITVFAGRNSTGKQIRHYRTFTPEQGKTQKQIEKDVQKAAFEFEREIEQGYVADNRQTFQQYADYVIDLKVRTGIKHRTIFYYKTMLERINPIIGHLKLIEIRPQHLNAFYKKLGQDGENKLTRGKLSNKTILEHHRLISTIMCQAEKEMLIPYNPSKRATPPKNEKKRINYFQQSEIEHICD